MLNPIKTGAGFSDRSPDQSSQRDDRAPHRPPEPPAAAAPEAAMHLVIEHDDATHHDVYKLIDGATGQVVKEQLDDQVARLAGNPDYRAGTVISTKA